MNYLLGFYRHNNQFVSVTSKSDTFKDGNMSSIFRAVINPLKFSQTDSDWLRLPNLYNSHPVMDELFSKRLICHTSSDPADFDQLIAGYSVGVLMHVPVNDPSMTRTGVMVVKEGEDWVPLTIYHNNTPFLVECKGWIRGCGYLSIHSRTQAGTTKTHQRVTGGMVKESMEKEFENLLKVNSYYNFEVDGMLPFACIGFEYSNHDYALQLGLVFRLSPSNIRYSYTEFGDFNCHDFSRETVYSIFSNINQSLFSVGLRHQNLNSNNLVYSKPGQFIVTDYEEMDSIYQVPASLDSETDSRPLFLKVYPYRYIYQSKYTTPDCHKFYSPSLFQSEIQQAFTSSHATFSEYYELGKRFVGPEYFSMNLKAWVSTHLKPLLEQQHQHLLGYMAAAQSSKEVSFLDYIKPYVNDFNLKQLGIDDLGDFFMKLSLSVFFLLPFDVCFFTISRRVRHLESLLRHIDYLLHSDTFYSVRSSYQTPFLIMPDLIDYWDIYLLMFPFLQWVTHWQYFTIELL